ncbi:trypsin-like serine peptidase [Streptomyces sp. NBC_01304]|uniref:trypsin-like serine peptidase n=1 Tax=Streptomyces sp. NBC_01304 TaxID=2903818 RepID=UPI002E14D16B|nr:trypsin-like serine protease [Streptomyces sp. NBC_01304]
MIGILSVVAAALAATTFPAEIPAGSPAGDTAADVRAYWTPERMREAVVATDGAAEPPDGVPWTLGAEPVRNVGRLFLTVPPAEEGGKERKAYCSAAVVDSANRSVVVTAGHCVHLKSIPGGWVKKLLFVPAYDKKSEPYGSYVAESVGIAPAWAEHEDHKADFAFVTLGKDEQGRSVQDVTGARKASFAPVAGEKTALGYPFLKPYDGETLQYCSGPTTPVTDNRLVGGEQLKPCRMTNGASGGPWYARTPQGEDVQVGVTSSRPKDEAFQDAAWGAMFDATARELFQAQERK